MEIEREGYINGFKYQNRIISNLDGKENFLVLFFLLFIVKELFKVGWLLNSYVIIKCLFYFK